MTYESGKYFVSEKKIISNKRQNETVDKKNTIELPDIFFLKF